jgi:putative oxidoreductase
VIETWSLRCAELLVGAFYLGFGVANARSSLEIVETLRKRSFILPRVLFWAGVATQSGAGALLVLGYQASLAAILLIPFTLIAPLIFHPFWSMEGEARFLNRIIFLCDYTCVLGSLLLIVGADPDLLNLLSFWR